MNNQIYLTENRPLFLKVLFDIQKEFKKIEFYIGAIHNIKEYYFKEHNLPEIQDDSNFEIRYKLKRLPIEKWISVNTDWSQIILLLKTDHFIELHTDTMIIEIKEDSSEPLSVKNNFFIYGNQKFDDYIQDIAKRYNAVIKD